MSQEQGSDRERAPDVGGEAAASSPQYQVAALPEADVEKLQHLEEELREDTGEEVVVIAYKKEHAEPP